MEHEARSRHDQWSLKFTLFTLRLVQMVDRRVGLDAGQAAWWLLACWGIAEFIECVHDDSQPGDRDQK